MSLTHRNTTHLPAEGAASGDPFAMQLALSHVHTRLVPMRSSATGYVIDSGANTWGQLMASRGLAGYGLSRALRMLLDALRGLSALHETFSVSGERFVHGELSTAHLRIDPRGVCRLVPLTSRHFGQSDCVPPSSSARLTPEQLLGEPIDLRSDVFVAGVLLWEALAGRRLSQPATVEAMIARSQGMTPAISPLPPELAWAIPLKPVAMRALSVDRHQRFADCVELATAIASVAGERVASHAEVANCLLNPAPFERLERESTRFGGEASAAISAPRSASVAPSPRGSAVSRLISDALERPIPSRSDVFPAVTTPAGAQATDTQRLLTSEPPAPAVRSDAGLAPAGCVPVTPAPPPSSRARGYKSPLAALLLPRSPDVSLELRAAVEPRGTSETEPLANAVMVPGSARRQ